MSNSFMEGRLLKRLTIAGANYVNQKRLELNNINVFPVPDGDTGTNLALTLLAAAQAASEIKEKAPLGEVARILARASLVGAKGNSGFILSQLFGGLSEALEGKKKASVKEVAAAFNNGVLHAYQAVSNPREGTVLTVMRETFDFGQQIAGKTDEVGEWMGTILLRSRQVLALTPELLPILKQQGVVDAGGQGFVYFVEGMVRQLGHEGIPLPDALPPIGTLELPTLALSANPADHRFCTELLLKNSRLTPIELRWRLASHGSSLVAVGDVDLIRIHIHTDDPAFLEKMMKDWGMVELQKVEDMHEQQETRKVRVERGKSGRTLVITDSTADIPPDLARRYGIKVVPLEVIWGDKSFVDGVTIQCHDFYSRLRSEARKGKAGVYPTTSQPSPAHWEEAFDVKPKQYGNVFGVHLSGKLSGTVRTAAAFAHSKTGLAIQVMDSQSATLSLGLLALLAAAMAKQGVSLNEISKVIEEQRSRIKLLFCPRTLHYLQKGGRLGKASAFFGNLLNVKPLLAIDNGSIVVREKVLGNEEKALERMLELVTGDRKGCEVPPGDFWFGVMHTDCPEMAEKIAERISLDFSCPRDHILISEAGPVLGTYVGPGAFGISYWT